MTTPMETHGSKGMAMVASYRAARLSGRAALRDSLRRAEATRPVARPGLRPGVPGEGTAPGEPMPDPSPVAARPETGLPAGAAGSASIFAGLISLSITERDSAPPPGIAAIQPETAPAGASATAPDVTEPELPAAEPSAPELAAPELATPEPVMPELAAPELATPEPVMPEPVALPALDIAAAAAAAAATALPPAASATRQAAPGAAPAPRPELPDDPPLAEIGFGPGMLIRLSQIGLHTVGDLAQADVAQLRSALGDISRLVDVGTWINSARQSVAAHR